MILLAPGSVVFEVEGFPAVGTRLHRC